MPGLARFFICIMKLLNLRNKLKQEFKLNGIDVCDADFIIAGCLGVNRTELALIDEVSTKAEKQILKLSKQRLDHKPVDMLFKETYFYGLKFKVNKHVLTPRQDSEIVVEQAIKIINENNFGSVLDLCCGSGCLAVAIAKNTKAQVTASDVSAKAIKVAKANAKFNNAEIKFIKSHLFSNINGKFNLIISNPPYIETKTLSSLDQEVQKYDPALALDGGVDGLQFYRKIKQEACNYLTENGYLVLEIGFNQKQAVKEIFRNWAFVDCFKDLNKKDRAIIFRR